MSTWHKTNREWYCYCPEGEETRLPEETECARCYDIRPKILMILPEQNRLQWSDHHMLLALVTAQRSPDPNTHVGACIVDSMNRVVGLGYKGPPRCVSAEDRLL